MIRPFSLRQSGKEIQPDAWNLDFLTKFLKDKFNVTYMTGALSSILGEFGGTMLDWVNQDLGVQRAYALELARWVKSKDKLPQRNFQWLPWGGDSKIKSTTSSHAG